MPCVSPIRLKNPLFNNKDPAAIARREKKTRGSEQFIKDAVFGFSPFIDVPCGKCYGCMRMRCNGWVFRHLCELHFASSAHFVTLTYNDEHLPFTEKGNPCFCKTDVQKFLKRLRKWLSVNYPDVRIKYHVASEYGDTFGRPHYHMILYGFPNLPEALDQIPISWNLGNVDVGSVTEASIRYVVDYITQFYYDEEWDTPEEVPFAMYSNGLGSRMYPLVAEYLKNNPKPLYPINGRPFKIPNSYLTALNEQGFISNRLFYLIKYNSQKYYEDNKFRQELVNNSSGDSPFDREISIIKERLVSHRRKYKLRKQGVIK